MLGRFVAADRTAHGEQVDAEEMALNNPFFFFLNPNLYSARVQQRYRGGHVYVRIALRNVCLGR